MQERPLKPAEQPNRPASPRLFYFRHGETQWSLSGQHTGVTDIPLTPHGEAQARDLRPWVEALSFSHVLTSPRLRARATCEHAGLGGRSEIEPDLAEWNYGDYEGRRSSDIDEERPGWNIFRDGCPNGESPSEIGERADRLIGRLRTMDGDVALFSHGHFGAVFGARWIGLRGDRSAALLGSSRVDGCAGPGFQAPLYSDHRPLERRRRAGRVRAPPRGPLDAGCCATGESLSAPALSSPPPRSFGSSDRPGPLCR